MTPRVVATVAAASGLVVAAFFPLTRSYAQPPPAAEQAFVEGERFLERGEAWEASKSIERALALGYPAAKGYLRLADAYLALDRRLFDAREAIERSLAADPEPAAVWSWLADVNVRIDGLDAETRARRALREVVRREPAYPDALNRWRQFYLDPGDSRAMAAVLESHLEHRYDPLLALERIDILDEAGELEAARLAILDMRQHIMSEPYHSVLQYYEGVIAAAQGDHERGWKRYRSGLEAVADASSLRPFLRDLEPLLPVATIEAWEDLPVESRREILIGWWNARDPRPATTLNERWVEQQRRIRFSRRTFRFKKAWRLERLMALDASAFGRPSLAIRHGGRPMDDRAEVYLRHGHPDAQGNVGRDECGFWYYSRGDRDSTVAFAINFLQPEAFDARVRFVGNDCLYSQLPTTPEGLAHFAPGGLGGTNRLRVLERADRELGVALTTDSQAEEERESIEVWVTPVRFQDEAGDPEIAVYIAAPLEQAEDEMRRTVVVFDDRWMEVGRDVDVLTDAVPVGSHVIDVVTFRVPAGAYHIAVEIGGAERYGVERAEASVEPRGRGRVTVSDVVLTAVSGTSNEAFVRRGRTVVPETRRTFERGSPLRLYYEVYADAGEPIRMEYTVDAESLDRGALRSVFDALTGLVGVRQDGRRVTFAFDRVVTDGFLADEIAFDTADLPPGDYTIDLSASGSAGDASRRRVRFTLQ